MADKYCDLTINCSGHKYWPEWQRKDTVLEFKTYKVHKIIVCAQSDFFAKMCNGPWKESQENVVNFQNDDTIDCTLMEALLEFFYTGTFDHGVRLKDTEKPACVSFCVEAFAIGEKYMVEGLMEKATHKIEYFLVYMGKKNGKEDQLTYLINAIQLLYNLLPPTEESESWVARRGRLKAAIMNYANKFMVTLLDNEAFVELLEKDNGRLGIDLLRQSAFQKLSQQHEEEQTPTPSEVSSANIFVV
ncbi:hypothetical protein K490DRAFT_66617 [Saccharata proteae CBS 121410]|uniref:BTB domain-containing protein n=1 Tax=Saccharata proteae CBS 121410 TaxID=1314787 RepID=A0A9P4HT65_9PEZI|nr:hypothetical protein K490DRAFT_66617 [Saccharata proteae CBS 121410]